MKPSKKRKPLRSIAPRVGCPFCWEWLPTPTRQRDTYSQESLGGRCECGAWFVVDETGKSGGQALLDVQTLACGGDVERAMKLRENEDYELQSKPIDYQTSSGSVAVRGHSYMQPRVWALRLEPGR